MNLQWKKLNRAIYSGDNIERIFSPVYGPHSPIVVNQALLPRPGRPGDKVTFVYYPLHINYYAEHWQWVNDKVGWSRWQHQIRTRNDIEIIYRWGNNSSNFARSDCAKLGGPVDMRTRQIAIKAVLGMNHTKYFNVSRNPYGQIVKPYSNSSCYPPQVKFNEIGFSYLTCWQIGKPPSVPLFGSQLLDANTLYCRLPNY